jgi:peptide/nickel transport system permease protein
MIDPLAVLRFGRGIVGAVILAAIVVVALAAPILAPGDPQALVGKPLVVPFTTSAHLLGTDRLGRDVMAGIVHGAAPTLDIAVTATLAALLIGVAVGTAAGFAGGWLDEALMRLTEAFQAVPGFLLALAIVSVAGPTLSSIVSAIALSSWTTPARVMRAQVLGLKRREFVDAYRALGMHPVAIALREVVPNAIPPVITLASVIVAGAILIEAALSFLGLGDPNRVTWGSMIADGRAVLRTAPWLSAVPGIAIMITVIAVNLVGDALNEALAPRRVGA